ncbi:Inner membrane mitoribosome receptor MBA1, mitochondrial [Wickerhamiella sorbophila]|uniref:Inner membrane mitoribosome receptor MBA1, mitochondrial n=1 Tax=Wickerhamiella sorbophila TaxID=45607 RepID=A0A2T0FNV8_9ASCO|nr:Inner membrane mitoribosome receptor MBA1, mitochondrial [Wickerhamiella sorbophila]PRT56665.1 Inner membrane mitoribosome receptor MBA1, mitochondrial [Wickerhamiella sorbophila]
MFRSIWHSTKPSQVISRAVTRSAATTTSPVQFSMDQAGLVTDLYVPPRDLPSWFTNPKARWTALKRRVQLLGVNTYMAVKLRREIGRERFQPLEWKETALLLYQRTNECFVHRDLSGLSKLTSRWVYGPLAARAQKFPKNVRLDWKLEKLTAKPKVLSIIPLSLPDTPTRFVQTLYRIESRQVLSKLNLDTNKVDKVERTVVDNVAFIFDTTKSPAEGRLIGSLFETPVNSPMPDPTLSPGSRTEIIRSMTSRGDIFREPPQYLAIKTEQTA